VEDGAASTFNPPQSIVAQIRNKALVRILLEYAAGILQAGDRFDLASPPGARRDEELQWALDAGLGPMLYRVANEQGWDALPEGWHAALLSADLTARVRHGCLVAAASDVVATCTELGVRPTLLKGISTSDELYPEGHLRPMGDIDVLIPDGEMYRAVESALVDRGYAPCDGACSHHGQPLLHPSCQVAVELHTDLFPSGSGLDAGNAFSRPRVLWERAASTFHGLPVFRFSPELQVAYIASSWMADLTRLKVQASFVPSMVDAIYLLRAKGDALDWERLSAGLDNPLGRASTFVTVSYLARRGLASVPAYALSLLRRGRSVAGPVQTLGIHAMLDRYLVAGRRWDLPFPPPVPGRYGIRFQFEKRILRRLRGILGRT